jgi:N-acetyl-D-muramate 6-phosphate phosphatase
MLQPKAVLFDLDGTLLDTAADLGKALNRILAAKQLAPINQELIRPAAGQGCKGLLKLGLGLDIDHPSYAELAENLLNYYQEHLFDTTQLFAGMETVLAHLEEVGIAWGIVTNKPTRFTNSLAEKLKLDKRALCIVSGDTLDKRKPHPEPILHACKLLNLEPSECLYVGDSEVDIIASKAAGTTSLVAMYGYIPESVNPKSWNADGYIKHPEEIIEWLALRLNPI